MAGPNQTETGRRMKRSRALQITGLMAGAGFSLTACGSPSDVKPVRAFLSYSECQAENPAAACLAALNQADTVRRDSGPRFNSREACEQNWGDNRCERTMYGAGGGIYAPHMAGFLMPQTVNGVRQPAAPLYQEQEGEISNGYGGGYVSRAFFSGRTTTNPADHTPAARSAYARSLALNGVESRGGFGGYRSSYVRGYSG